MLIVAPSGIANDATSLCTPSRCSTVLSVTGNVAPLDDVVNATSMGWRILAKNRSGCRRPSNTSSSGYTTVTWITSASTTLPADFGEQLAHQARDAVRGEFDQHADQSHQYVVGVVEDRPEPRTGLAGTRDGDSEQNRKHDDLQHVALRHRCDRVGRKDVDQYLRQRRRGRRCVVGGGNLVSTGAG